METETLPWLFAILTAGWFGWMAIRAERKATLWAVGGAAFGLVVSTLVLGLGRATCIPFSDHDRTADQLHWFIVAFILIAIVGWLLTAGLHRQHLWLWSKINPRSHPTPPPPNPSPTKPTPQSTATRPLTPPGKPQP